jgi:hypothetical protein
MKFHSSPKPQSNSPQRLSSHQSSQNPERQTTPSEWPQPLNTHIAIPAASPPASPIGCPSLKNLQIIAKQPLALSQSGMGYPLDPSIGKRSW